MKISYLLWRIIFHLWRTNVSRVKKQKSRAAGQTRVWQKSTNVVLTCRNWSYWKRLLESRKKRQKYRNIEKDAICGKPMELGGKPFCLIDEYFLLVEDDWKCVNWKVADRFELFSFRRCFIGLLYTASKKPSLD